MNGTTYDRELIARMLTELASMGSSIFLGASISEQAELLIAADNADAAGVRTVNATDPVRAQFEAWASSPDLDMDISRHPEDDVTWAGQYIDAGLQLAWEAWQAALAQQPAAVDEAMVERMAQAVATELYGEPPPPGGNSLTRAMMLPGIKRVLAAALAQQSEAPANFRAAEHDGGGFSSDTAALAFLALIGNGNPNVSHAVERLRTSLIAQQPEVADEAWRAGFVGGAKWWEWEMTGATMWQSDQQRAYEAAIKSRPNVTPQPAIPEGWSFVRQDDGSIVARAEGYGAACVREGDNTSVAAGLLYLLAADLLAARPTQEPDHG